MRLEFISLCDESIARFVNFDCILVLIADLVELKMADSLSMSLDEMVKRSKAAKKSAGKGVSRGGAKGAGRGAGGPVRRGPLAVKARPSSFSNKASSRIWDLLSV